MHRRNALRLRATIASSGRRLGRMLVRGLLLTLSIATIASGQQSPPQPVDDREVIRQLLVRITVLEKRVNELEAKQGPAAAAPPATGVEAAAPKPAPQEEHADMSQGGPTLRIRGFGDVGLRGSNLRGDTTSFALGQLDLFVTSRLSDRVSFLSEIVFESGDNNAFGVDVERLLLQFAPSDYFNLGIGRYHTGIGYYNTAYHHGTWFQTTTGRPFIFQFEDDGGILPVHNVGVTATGRIPSRGLGLHYIAEVGNGRTSRSPLDEAVQNVIDENNGKAVNLGLFARPDQLPGFQAGFSFYHDGLKPDGLPRIGQSILAAHVVYVKPSFEWLNEALVIRHAVSGSPLVFHTPAFYTQISRRFGVVRPYFRYEYVNASGREPIFSDVGRRDGPSFGLRYDVSDFAAIKLQYNRTARRGLRSINGLELQLAFAF